MCIFCFMWVCVRTDFVVFGSFVVWWLACQVRAKIQQASGSHEDLLAIVKRGKRQWYGHVSRSSGLAKTILQGTVKGGRRQGRQRKRWEDNIRDWTGLGFAKSQRAVENREIWRKLVAKSCGVPQRPSRLRDRWWWWSSVSDFGLYIRDIMSRQEFCFFASGLCKNFNIGPFPETV